METPSSESFDVLLRRGGLSPTETDKRKLKELYESLLPRLQALHDANLDDEEVAGRYVPQWP
ncbi:MAG: hypothetical protein HY681_04330 [Chloroflexi bacterium]|nr:hypothetical protein [Chloroflexota bacterium]